MYDFGMESSVDSRLNSVDGFSINVKCQNRLVKPQKKIVQCENFSISLVISNESENFEKCLYFS